MDAAVAGLIGAGTGAVTGLLTGIIGGWQSRRSEAQRWRQSRADEVWKTERGALIELTTLIATGCQAMAWLAWASSVKDLESAKIEADIYDQRMRELLPRIFSAQAAASGLNDATYETIQVIVARLIELDTALSTEGINLNSTPHETLARMSSFEPIALDLARQVVETVREHLRSAN